MADAIVLANESATIVGWNKGAEMMFGYLEEEIRQFQKKNVSIETAADPKFLEQLEAQHLIDALDRDIDGRARVRASGQHLTLTGPFELAVELFVD